MRTVTSPTLLPPSPALNRAEKVPADVLAKYGAKRKEKLFPVVCAVADKRCPQCGMELSIAEIDKLSGGKFIECDSCHRILFKKK